VREVTARIRAITRRVMLANNPQTENKTLSLTLGDLVVLPDQLRARRGDKVIELSIRDIDILTVFHESNVNLITRDHLFNQAWGFHHMPNSRTLDQHISQQKKNRSKLTRQNQKSFKQYTAQAIDPHPLCNLCGPREQ